MSAITSAAPQPDSAPSATPATRAERLLTQFTEFRSELDEHQAQRERVIRCSREITAVSKKTIFSLQRMGTGASKAVVFKEAEQKLGQLRVQFELVQKEVQGADFWRYERSISPGLQEYVRRFGRFSSFPFLPRPPFLPFLSLSSLRADASPSHSSRPSPSTTTLNTTPSLLSSKPKRRSSLLLPPPTRPPPPPPRTPPLLPPSLPLLPPPTSA